MEEGPQDFCTGESEVEEGCGREQDKALTACYLLFISHRLLEGKFGFDSR